MRTSVTLKPSTHTSPTWPSNRLRLRRRAILLSLLRTEKSSSQDLWSTSAPPWPGAAPAFIAPLNAAHPPSFLSIPPKKRKKKSHDDPSVPLFLWPAPSPPPGCFLFQNPFRHPLHTQLVMNGWRKEKHRCDTNVVCLFLLFFNSFTQWNNNWASAN